MADFHDDDNELPSYDLVDHTIVASSDSVKRLITMKPF